MAITENNPSTRPITYDSTVTADETKTFTIRGRVNAGETITLNVSQDGSTWAYVFTEGTSNTTTTNNVTVAYNGIRDFVITNNTSSTLTVTSFVYEGRPARVMCFDTNLNPLNMETRIRSGSADITLDEPAIIGAGSYRTFAISLVPSGGVPFGIEKIRARGQYSSMIYTLCITSIELYSNGMLDVTFYNPTSSSIVVYSVSASARYLSTTENNPPGLFIYEQA